MSKRSIESRSQELLARARELAKTSGLTWVEANNAIYGPAGPFARLFPNVKERAAFAKTKESRQVDRLIDSLPEPPLVRRSGSTAASSMCAFPSRCTLPWQAKRKPRA